LHAEPIGVRGVCDNPLDRWMLRTAAAARHEPDLIARATSNLARAVPTALAPTMTCKAIEMSLALFQKLQIHVSRCKEL
jgi:hypothetical protein